jgi:hypothetical protein
LEALDYKEKGQPVPESWLDEKMRLLEKIEQPTVQVRLGSGPDGPAIVTG